MAIIKCKMCGGDMELAADKTIGTCEYCGTQMTLPKVADDQRATAFNRGNHFRRIGEFDKALAVYESIVRENDTDAEAHWCCALCRFGIEYVEDPATYEWIPTCHRASFDSFLEDVDYLAAVKHSDGITQRQYQKDAAKIAEVQKGILSTSQNEEPYDVFICYKESDENGNRTPDSALAQDIYYQLTEQGRRVFFARITLEDVVGKQYEPYIFAALNSAKVMIVVGTKAEYLNAVWVKNEWSRFLVMMKKDRSKLLLPCYRDMDPYDMPEQLSVLQSYDMSKIGFIQDLTRGIAKVLDSDKKPESVHETVVVQQPGSANVAALLKRGKMALEDGDWEKADGFFEDVLNQDAECAEAYLGKALARGKCAALDVFIRKRKENTEENQKKKANLDADNAHIAEMVEKYVVSGYVEEEDIRELYDFDLSYFTSVGWRKHQKQEEKNYWENHKQLSRAEQFASGEMAQALKTAKQQLFAQLDERILKAVEAETVAKERLNQVYAAHVAKADEQAKQLYEKGNIRRESDYQRCEADVKTAACVEDLQELAEVFDSLRGYKESKKLAEHCRKRIEEERIRQKEESERRKAEAIKLETQRRKSNIKVGVFIATVVVVVVAFALIATKVIIPGKHYSNAKMLMENEQYEEAIAVFEEIADFKDSEQQVVNCQTAIKDLAYEAAWGLYSAGRYEEAAEAFRAMDGYKNSDENIVMCETAILEEKYVKATTLQENQDYEEAYNLFTSLGTYSNSEKNAKACAKEYAEILGNEGEYSSAATWYERGESQNSANKMRYLYVQENYTCTDWDTYYYLEDLIDDRYIGAQSLYDELYKQQVKIVVNTRYTDYTTSQTSFSHNDNIFIHIQYVGGKPWQNELNYDAKIEYLTNNGVWLQKDSFANHSLTRENWVTEMVGSLGHSALRVVVRNEDTREVMGQAIIQIS